MPSTIDRYLLKEVTLVLLATLLVLLVVVLSNHLAGYLSQVARGGLAKDAVFTLLGLQAIRFLATLIPLALLLSIMLGLGRLYRDSEMIALNACGLGPWGIYRPLFILVIPLAGLLTGLSLYVSPWCADLQFELQARARKDAELTMFVPGTFREINGGQQVVYVSAVEDQGKELRKVFIQSQLPDGVAVTTGERGHQQIDAKSGARYIVLNDGYRYEGTPGKGDYQSVHFRRAAMRIESAPAEQTWQRREAIPSSELFHSTTPSHAAELQKRFSKPLSLFLLAVLAPLLARAQPREGRYGRLVAAILIYSIYANLLEIAEAWLAHGRVWSPLGLWWVHALVLATGAGLWVSQYGFFGLSSARKR